MTAAVQPKLRSSEEFPAVASRWTVLLPVLGLPALLPLVFMAPGVIQGLVTGNGGVVHDAGNDVYGTGGALLLLTMLCVTPLRTLTREQWFVPLRRWYGVVFGLTIFFDAATASNDPAFAGAPVARLGAHSFLLIGTLMTLIVVPLFIQGVWNQATMRQLGKYWKPLQRYGTYSVWALLGIHLLLLEGFGVEHADAIGPDHAPYDVVHQRFYQFAACSGLLLTLRLPPVRRWIRDRQDAGKGWQAWLAIAPLIALFLLGYVFLVNELMYKGIAALHLAPVQD